MSCNKPYSGTFNVRIGPQLHRDAVIAANSAGINLNEFVTTAIEATLKTVSASPAYQTAANQQKTA